jgi:ribonucleotide reductase alpha subunit
MYSVSQEESTVGISRQNIEAIERLNQQQKEKGLYHISDYNIKKLRFHLENQTIKPPTTFLNGLNPKKCLDENNQIKDIYTVTSCYAGFIPMSRDDLLAHLKQYSYSRIGAHGVNGDLIPICASTYESIGVVTQLHSDTIVSLTYSIWNNRILELFDYIHPSRKIEGVNFIIGLTNDFKEAVNNNAQWDLYEPSMTQIKLQERSESMHRRSVNAVYLYNRLLEVEAQSGIGIINLDNMNNRNMNKHLGKAVCTNICTEILPVGDFACTLCGFNLNRFIRDKKTHKLVVKNNAEDYSIWSKMNPISSISSSISNSISSISNYISNSISNNIFSISSIVCESILGTQMFSDYIPYYSEDNNGSSNDNDSDNDNDNNDNSSNNYFDWVMFEEAIEVSVMLLNLAIDIGTFTKNKRIDHYNKKVLRPIGLGVTAFADCLMYQNIEYENSSHFAYRLTSVFLAKACETSMELGKLFPENIPSGWEGSEWSKGKLPVDMWKQEELIKCELLDIINSPLNADLAKRFDNIRMLLKKFPMINLNLIGHMPTLRRLINSNICLSFTPLHSLVGEVGLESKVVKQYCAPLPQKYYDIADRNQGVWDESIPAIYKTSEFMDQKKKMRIHFIAQINCDMSISFTPHVKRSDTVELNNIIRYSINLNTVIYYPRLSKSTNMNSIDDNQDKCKDGMCSI